MNTELELKFLEILEWFIQEDDTWDIPDNGYWIGKLEEARELVAVTKGDDYEPLEWDNWSPSDRENTDD